MNGIETLVDATVATILDCQKKLGLPHTLADPEYRFLHILVVAGMKLGRDLPPEVSRVMADEFIRRVKLRGELKQPATDHSCN